MRKIYWDVDPHDERAWDIEPCPAPRQTQRDKWRPRPCVQKYRAFRDLVKLHGIDVHSHDWITFYMPMPKSWTEGKKKEMEGMPHMQKPDLDNLVKALLDACFRGLDDAHIYSLTVYKCWARKGRIKIRRVNNDWDD